MPFVLLAPVPFNLIIHSSTKKYSSEHKGHTAQLRGHRRDYHSRHDPVESRRVRVPAKATWTQSLLTSCTSLGLKEKESNVSYTYTSVNISISTANAVHSGFHPHEKLIFLLKFSVPQLCSAYGLAMAPCR